MAVLVDWNDPANWDLFYFSYDGASETSTGYSRDWATDFGRNNVDEPGTTMAQRADWLLGNFTIGTTDRILIVGCGFGYLIEVLHGRGYLNCWGIDSSSDIESRKGTEASGDIVLISEEMSGVGRVNAILRDLTGDDEFDWIITESVFESYDDSDIQVICNVIEGALLNTVTFANAIHMVYEPPWGVHAGVFNEKTLAEWVAVRPAHSWMSLDTGAHVHGTG